jgi:hypothetical protein
MKLHESIIGVLGDNVIYNVLTVLVAAFLLGLVVKPYQSLPERVESLERSNIILQSKMIEQERKLDLVVCFLETEANGGNPLSCSR